MSTGERTIALEVNGVALINATVETNTDVNDFGRSYRWSVIATKTNTNGNPLMIIEGSNDNVNWVNPYFDKEANLPIQIELNEEKNTAFDDIFPFSYFRIRTLPNGNTTGVVEYLLNVHF